MLWKGQENNLKANEQYPKKGAVQKEKLFQVELNQNVDLSRFLNKQKGHPKVENTTFWTAPSLLLVRSCFRTRICPWKEFID